MSRWLVLLAVALALVAATAVGSFFVDLAAFSGPSSGDTAVFVQAYHNMVSGRPFQSSLFYEDSRQFTNDSPYLNMLVWHGYFLAPLLLAPLYVLGGGLTATFAVWIAIIMAGTAGATYLLARRIAGAQPHIVAALTSAALAASGYLRNMTSLLVPSTMATPFVVLMHLGAVARRRWVFALGAACLCLLQEDLALDVLGYAVVALVLLVPREEKAMRRAIAVGGVLALLYFLGWNLVLQPAIRAELTPVRLGGASMLGFRLSQFSSDPVAFILAALEPKGLVRVFGPLLVLAAIGVGFGLAFERRRPFEWRPALALTLGAPLVHVAYSVYTHGDRHATTVLAFGYIAFVHAMADVDFSRPRWPSRSLVVSAVALVAALTLLGVVFMPNYVAGSVIGRALGLTDRPLSRDGGSEAIASDSRVTRYVNALPRSASVTLWANHPTEGFVAARSDLWLFPSQYDESDYLVIQRDARRTTALDLGDLDYSAPGTALKPALNPFGPVRTDVLERVVTRLVEEDGTHEVVEDEAEGLLVLRRREKAAVAMPASTVGFGWAKHLLPGRAR